MLKHLSFALSMSILVAIAVSCGKNESVPEFPPQSVGTASRTVANASQFTATIYGKVLYAGMPHQPSKVQMSADPYCASHVQNSAKTDDVVVNPNGSLSNVIVYVKSGVEGMTFATPTTPIVIDQHNCAYHPHVFTMMVNQPLVVKNSDATLHNIHIWATINRPFNVGQPVQNMETTLKFDKPEMPVPIRCDVHKWMSAFAGIFDHPFHTVTHEAGTFELKVPPGKYEIAAWQEKFGEQTQKVEIGNNEKEELVFIFKDSEIE